MEFARADTIFNLKSSPSGAGPDGPFSKPGIDRMSRGEFGCLVSPSPPGVFYQCQRCTACCRWPGDVRIDDGEIKAIARFLALDEDSFIQRYTRLRSDRQGLSLIEKDNHECIMLDGDDCRIQPVKPTQCRGFPNTWNFPGWERICHAIPLAVPVPPQRDSLQDRFA